MFDLGLWSSHPMLVFAKEVTMCDCWCQEVKHHPASVDLELVKRLAATTTTSNLKSFLYKEFSCISKDYAGHPPPCLPPSPLPPVP